MIEAHVLDAWTLRSRHATQAFGYLNLVGGFAAPLFLWLAGFSLVLAAEKRLQRTGDRTAAARALAIRGLEIFVLAFIFRAQSFIVSPGNPLVSLLRVDILNIMGPAMAVAALLWGVAGNSRRAALACGLAGTGIALAAPIVRTVPLGALPPAVQWYISPAGNHSTFTLFPWSGFVLAGAAFGTLLAAAARAGEGRALGRLAAAGFAIAGASYYASCQPSIYTASSFWTTSPTYFGLRVGVMMLAMGALYALEPAAALVPRAFGVLGRFGRHSLFVYWVHVELVYGYATAPLHHRLPLWLNALAYLLFALAMYRSIDLRDRVVAWWQARSTLPPTRVSADA